MRFEWVGLSSPLQSQFDIYHVTAVQFIYIFMPPWPIRMRSGSGIMFLTRPSVCAYQHACVPIGDILCPAFHWFLGSRSTFFAFVTPGAIDRRDCGRMGQWHLRNTSCKFVWMSGWRQGENLFSESVFVHIGNKSVPIQLAQCWFPRLVISNAEI